MDKARDKNRATAGEKVRSAGQQAKG